jgi:hypothetical protein
MRFDEIMKRSQVRKRKMQIMKLYLLPMSLCRASKQNMNTFIGFPNLQKLSGINGTGQLP